MESIIARALEYTLKYWLKTFSRDQFKLQGRTVQLSNLDINGDALHSSMGLPPALVVTKAKVGKLVITLPYVSLVQTEPIIVQIDRVDVVLEEKTESTPGVFSSFQSAGSSGRGSGYGFADKIADGMSIEVHTFNLLLETRGGAHCQEGATWASPLASITIHNFLLYTTNEHWKIVNLKEARDFSSGKKLIYVFRKLEWGFLSVDLLPHPDMFVDSDCGDSPECDIKRDGDGAKRVLFGGERIVDGISGQAYITVKRTELNHPLGLEVQLNIPEIVFPALTEPGLRALLRFFTGLYICLNRGDLEINDGQIQKSTEAAGCSLVSVIVDHIFLSIKDPEFQLEFLMQSLLFSRACTSHGEISKSLMTVMIDGLFLRDTFLRPPCTLIQPSMGDASHATDSTHTPDFSRGFCSKIYPLEEFNRRLQNDTVPLISLHSLQVRPSPTPLIFASKTEIFIQPLTIHLQEQSCLRICSLLADGIIVSPGAVLPDFSINSILFTLVDLDLMVPFESVDSNTSMAGNMYGGHSSSFTGARIHVENMQFFISPSLKFQFLNLEKDPACFSLWEDQPVDASLKKLTVKSSLMSLSLESQCIYKLQSPVEWSSGLLKCIEVEDMGVEVAMATSDGRPLKSFPPSGGLVRVGVSCNKFSSNTSVPQLFFVLDFYSYLGRVSENIARVKKSNVQNGNSNGRVENAVMEKTASDTAVSLDVRCIRLRFMEMSSEGLGFPLAQFVGVDLSFRVCHRILGGAVAVSSTLCWSNVEVDCMEIGELLVGAGECHPSRQLRATFWIDNRRKRMPNGSMSAVPFLDVSVVHVIPYGAQFMECHKLNVVACVSGVRIGGGMTYAEALLRRFGILGPDGSPGEGLSKGLENLKGGPIAKLFKKPSTDGDFRDQKGGNRRKENSSSFLQLVASDDVELRVELKDWLFDVEGMGEMGDTQPHIHESGKEEEMRWQMAFHSIQMKANSRMSGMDKKETPLVFHDNPVDSVILSVEGVRILKPQDTTKDFHRPEIGAKGEDGETETYSSGMNLEMWLRIDTDAADKGIVMWTAESVKFSVKQPIEAVVTKDELRHVIFVCKSEVDSMGRIVAGILRVLQLEKSIGNPTLNQLTNLGSRGFENMFSSNKKLSVGNTKDEEEVIITRMLLEEAIVESQARCHAMIGWLDGTRGTVGDGDLEQSMRQLSEKLEQMQALVKRL